jgi:hypothetical protein
MTSLTACSLADPRLGNDIDGTAVNHYRIDR